MGSISDIIRIPGLVNVDLEDVKTVMREPGKAMMGTAAAGGPDRATKAAVVCPLLAGIDLGGARRPTNTAPFPVRVLVPIATSKLNFKLAESRNAMKPTRRDATASA